MRTAGWTVVSICLAMLVAWLWAVAEREAFVPMDGDGRRVGGDLSSVVPVARERGRVPSLSPTQLGGRRPASLRGTEVDGALVVDASGRFVATPDALELFDYFFVARREEPDDVIVARIRAEIERRLGPRARGDALELLARYLDYRQRAELLALGGPGGSPAEVFEALVGLRREVFGEQADVLFGGDETRTRVALAQREIAGDPAIPEQERRDLIESLHAELSEEERVARERATAAARLLRDEADLVSAGADAAEIHAHRVGAFGEEAAGRLARLDRRREAWASRVAAFRAERNAILSNRGLTTEEKDRAVRRAIEQRFEGPERLRVEALERIEADQRASRSGPTS